MVENLVFGQDIFSGPEKHIAFAVNTQGYNDAGFAGMVSSRFWPELANTGDKKLGDVMSHEIEGGRMLHALVCHPLNDDGWAETPKVITECLDAMPVADDETVAIVSIGGGPTGQAMGADPNAILSGMEASTKKLVIYSL